MFAIDPIELEEDIIIETDDIPEAVGDFPETDEDLEEEVDFADDGDDSDSEEDEDEPVKAKPMVIRKTKLRKGEFIESIKRIPMKGQAYNAKHFHIEIIGKKKGKIVECKVIWAEEPSGYTIGDVFEAAEIAFYSDYYNLSLK